MSARKVVQIVVQPAAQVMLDSTVKTALPGVFALCDDGTVWWRSSDSDGWRALPPIPQPADAAP